MAKTHNQAKQRIAALRAPSRCLRRYRYKMEKQMRSIKQKLF